ncbi:MAG: CHASE domain-containing protein [Pseudomonadota bacterium]
MTALAVFAIERVEAQRTDAQHLQMATTVTSAIERQANANVAYLRAGAAMLSTRPEVTAADLQQFARQLHADDTLRAGEALAWAPEISREQVPALERRLNSAPTGMFRVHPIPRQAKVLPVIYIEPAGVGRRALGLDIYSEPVRRAAADRARATGRPTASAPIELLVDSGARDRTGFVIVMPVYDGQGLALGGPGQGTFRGVIVRGFNARRFIESALAPEQLAEYGVAIYDGNQLGGTPLVTISPDPVPGRAIVRQIALADRAMTVVVTPPARSTLSNLALLTLLFGMLVAGLLLVVARLLTQQAVEDREALAWLEEQASIRNSLTRELNHRVKNTLANVLSIVALTRRRANSIDDFVVGLIGRVRALSATHDLLTQSEWGTTPIRAVVAAELAPYVQDADRAVIIRGPDVELAPNDALSLGLAIHELATNASKYGALSVAGGRVTVNWEMISDKLTRIEWCETGGPPVPEQRQRGFGTELIEKIVAHELRNPVDLTFGADGVRCILTVPVRKPASFQIRARKAMIQDNAENQQEP